MFKQFALTSRAVWYEGAICSHHRLARPADRGGAGLAPPPATLSARRSSEMRHTTHTIQQKFDVGKRRLATVLQKCWIGGTKAKPFVKRASESVNRSSEMLDRKHKPATLRQKCTRKCGPLIRNAGSKAQTCNRSSEIRAKVCTVQRKYWIGSTNVRTVHQKSHHSQHLARKQVEDTTALAASRCLAHLHSEKQAPEFERGAFFRVPIGHG